MRREIGLKTNFEDYYDELLLGVDNPSFLFYRKKGLLDKRLTLEYLNKEFNYFIPTIFKVSELNTDSFLENFDIIVFDKNKQDIKPWKTAVKFDSDKYGRFILKSKTAKSFITYKIGSIEVKTKKESDHPFRSDLMNSVEELLSIEENTSLDNNRCIYSIEFIDIDGVLVVINFDEAPKLENTLVKKIIPKEKVYEELLNWFRRKHV